MIFDHIKKVTFFVRPLHLLISGLTIASTSFASLDAVKLDLVPSDILVDCNRSFFKGVEKDDRTLYVTPHVVAGRSPIDGDRDEVHIVSTDEPGKYLMSIGIYFPRDAEDSKNSHEIRDSQSNFCNFESVRHFLNKDISNEDDKFVHIAHIPITSIDVKIAGLNIPAHVIGQLVQNNDINDVDILEYNDKSFTAEFIIDEDELNYINEHMSRDEGIQLDVLYRFQSRRKDGSVSVRIDASDIATNFKASAQGQKYMVEADLQATLQTAIARSNIEIDINAGKSDAFNTVSQKIMDKVLSQINFTTAPEDIEFTELQAQKPNEKIVSVEAVAQAIIAQNSTDFSFRQTSLPETTTAATTTRVTHEAINPHVYTLTVKDGFGPTTTAFEIKAGETFKFRPAYTYIARRDWKEKASYLTINQMGSLGVFNIYLDAGNPKMNLKPEEVNGHLIAQGYWYSAYYFPLPWDGFYRWRRIQRYPVLSTRARISLVNIKNESDLEYVPITVAFGNVGMGYAKFTLEELLAEEELFTATLSRHGEITITAHEDLGQVSFRETFKRPYYEQTNKEGKPIYDQKKEVCKMVEKTALHGHRTLTQKEEVCSEEYMYDFKVSVKNLDEVVQEYYYGKGIGGNKVDTNPQPIRGRIDKWALEMYQAMVIAMTRPSTKEKQPSNLSVPLPEESHREQN